MSVNLFGVSRQGRCKPLSVELNLLSHGTVQKLGNEAEEQLRCMTNFSCIVQSQKGFTFMSEASCR